MFKNTNSNDEEYTKAIVIMTKVILAYVVDPVHNSEGNSNILDVIPTT